VVPWVVSWAIPAVYTVGAGVLAGLSLLLLRAGSYREHHSLSGSVALGFLDVLAYLGVIGLAIWTFVFPIAHPFPSDMMLYLFYLPSLPIGVYSLAFIWAMLILVRVVLMPFTRPVTEKLYRDIEGSLRELSDAVSQVEHRLQETGNTEDPQIGQKVTSMLNELSAVRKELSSLKGSGPLQREAPSAFSGFRVLAEPQGQVVMSSQKPSEQAPKQVLTVIRPQAQPVRQPESAVPDSMTDNPWLSVLAKRKATEAPKSASES
jgi:hypothetical protein